MNIHDHMAGFNQCTIIQGQPSLHGKSTQYYNCTHTDITMPPFSLYFSLQTLTFQSRLYTCGSYQWWSNYYPHALQYNPWTRIWIWTFSISTDYRARSPGNPNFVSVSYHYPCGGMNSTGSLQLEYESGRGPYISLLERPGKAHNPSLSYRQFTSLEAAPTLCFHRLELQGSTRSRAHARAHGHGKAKPCNRLQLHYKPWGHKHVLGHVWCCSYSSLQQIQYIGLVVF